MYYAIFGTTLAPSSINRASMDGTNPTTLVNTGLEHPWGITIDFKTSRLFWTDMHTNKIESSSLQGCDRRTVISLSDVGLLGIAVSNERIYWGEYSGKKLQSSTKDGKEVITLHGGTNSVLGVALVPDLNLPQNRTNHCARNSCSRVCVLTTTSSRCLT